MTASPIPLRPEAPALSTLQPPGWKKPRGYANGMAGRGTVVMTGGLIGWDENEVLAEGFIPQVEQILRNILAVLGEAGAGPEHVARLTWYVRSVDTYRASLAELGPVYRRVMGRHFPAMALVGVADLVEPGALVEIEATAIVPDAA
ncbi:MULTISPECIES: RidA family protein [Methylobacterium]|uniref:RidA family protein n=1 Tax=Methylobacterium TaxID=407 RepID=UPI0013EA341F|nr:RidA family protein [Methylobacterium sp. DB0501]NGM32842.1 RidA family protein [Methylobacterium sp. DB0501]